jgi:uncharacterized protein YjbJ (UPF0337 family)
MQRARLGTPFAEFEHRSRGGEAPSASLALLSDAQHRLRRAASHPALRRSRALYSSSANGVLGAILEMDTDQEAQMNWNEDEVRGKIDQAAGKVKEKVGRLTDDPVLQDEGSDQRVAGDIEHGVGKARRKVGEALEDMGNKIGR